MNIQNQSTEVISDRNSEAVSAKAKIVAENFHWWSTTAQKYLDEGNWTDGRVQFIEERYSIHERVQKALGRGGYKLTVPGNVKAASWSLEFDVKLAVVVSGFRSKEYVHILQPKNQPHLILYRTKDKAKSLEHGSTVTGKVWANKKVLFAGHQFPVASKVVLK